MKKVAGASLLAVAVLFTSAVHTLEAQPKKVPRIGYLFPGFPVSESARPFDNRQQAFYSGLREQGFAVGKDVIIDYKYLERKSGGWGPVATELAGAKVNLIVATSSPAIHAVTRATTKIPIIIISVNDPIAKGWGSSWPRPGRNITGVSILRPGLNGKLLELLVEAVPRVTRFAALRSSRSDPVYVEETESVARAANVDLQTVTVSDPKDLGNTFLAMTKARIGGLVLLPSVLFVRNMGQIAKLAVESRMPAIFWRTVFAERGGFMAFGPNILDQFRRAGVLAGKILRGSKPADLPMEQSMKFDLVINLRVAKQIGITVPANVLYRADRVIK